VTLLLTILGILVLLLSVAGIAFGGFMALDPQVRGAGVIFGLWWVSGVVAALGILVRDSATFAIGLFCFTVAGLALLVEERLPRKPAFRHRVWYDEDEEVPQNDQEDTRDDEPSQESAPEEPDGEAAENATGNVDEHPQAPAPNDHPETSIIADENEAGSKDSKEDGPEEQQPETDGPEEKP